jgi:hypothetical protein
MVTPRSLAPAQVVPTGLLGALRLPAAPGGVVLGRDAGGSALLAPLFGPTAIDIVYIGGWWAAQVVVNRCLAHGATVIVDAVDGGLAGRLASLPQWLALARVTGGNQVAPLINESPLINDVTQSRPALIVHDVGPQVPGHLPSRGAWQTTLTVLSRVGSASERVLASAAMVLTQRLDAREAATVAATLGLPDGATAALGRLDHESIAICRPGRIDHVWLTPTTVERQVFG